MDEKGINQLELSEKTGLTPMTIGRLYLVGDLTVYFVKSLCTKNFDKFQLK